MQIPPNQLFVLGSRGWEEFDCLQQPLPDRIKVLLCLVDGLSGGGVFKRSSTAWRPSPKPRSSQPSQ